MSKFKVGDRVVGLESASEKYSITDEGYKDIVQEVDGDYIYLSNMRVHSRHFALVSEVKNKNIMTNIIEFVKNLTLSADEKLLRKQGLKNECGNYTTEAKELVMNKLTAENEAYLVDIATKKEAEEKSEK